MNPPGLRSPLLQDVAGLVAQAAVVYRGTPSERVVGEIFERIHEPLRVAIAGRVKAGKSTLLNALVGDELAPTDAGECTRIVTWYRHGITYRVTMTPRDGAPQQLAFDRVRGVVVPRLQGFPPENIERLTVEWPVPALETMTLIDTPGIGSITESNSARTLELLTPDNDETTPSDAVIYLMRHLHGSDVNFLQAFHEDEFAQPSPVDCIGVLSRADEVAVGRSDPLEAAHQVAERYSADPRLRRLVQQVVPVTGLIAQAGAGLEEDEFRRLRTIAGLSDDALDGLLLSADRFANSPLPDGPSSYERAALLDRLGVYGVRISLDMIRTGRAATAGQLAASLLERSGVLHLRKVLLAQFTDRRDTLKARSAILALQRLLAVAPVPGAVELVARLDQVRAGAHELTELRLLNGVRLGEVAVREQDTAEIEQLLGVQGTTPRARLGLAPDAPVDDLRVAALAMLDKWRRRSESSVSSLAYAEASRVLVRTCEGIYAGVIGAGPQRR